jgi:hypothetical protein
MDYLVHDVPIRTWSECDYAPFDPNYKGVVLPPTFQVTFPNGKPFCSMEGRVLGIKFSLNSRFPNVDMGTSIKLARVPNDSVTNADIDMTLNTTPIRVFKSGQGFRYRGLHVLTAHEGTMWVFRRLSDAVQAQFPPLDEWLKTMRSFGGSPSPATSPAATSRMRPIDTLMLGWFCDKLCAGATKCTVATESILPHLGDALGRGHGCEPMREALLLRLATLDVCVDWEVRVTSEFYFQRPLSFESGDCGEPQFKSRVELEHFLLLSYFFGPVYYERTSINYEDGGQLRMYTPDFELPTVSNLCDRSDVRGGPLLIESKAEYPSRQELSKCEAVMRMGRNIVLLYGYACSPDPELPLWRRRGLRGVAFERRGLQVQVVHDSLVLCIDDDGLVRLRPIAGSTDSGPDHPTLLRLYEQIHAI